LGIIRGEPFDLRAGKIGFAVGGGLETESLSIDFDGLTKIGKVPGLNGQGPTAGSRRSYNFFGEFRFPLTSPDMDIPVFNSLEVTAAGRFESIDPGGDKAVPKVSMRWQPIDDQVILRGSYSQSFIAPSTWELFGGQRQNNPTLSFPPGLGGQVQETIIDASNPDLEPRDAENYGGGVVLSPKAIKGLTVSCDYYHIKTRNDIFRTGYQNILNDLEAKGSASQFAPGFSFADGSPITSTASNQISDANFGTFVSPLVNGAEVETDGVDLQATYQLVTDSVGTFNFYAGANFVFKFLYDDPVIHTMVNPVTGAVTHGPFHYEGEYTDNFVVTGPQGTLPDYTVTAGLSWDIHDFTYSVNARYVPQVKDRGDAHPSVGVVDTAGKPLNDFTIDGTTWTVQDWFEIDMQLTYEFGRHESQRSWYGGTKVTIGVNNVTDEVPPIIASSSEDNTDKSVYDIIGRFVYVQASKKF
jgi:iron complex outermembrane receptor protein